MLISRDITVMTARGVNFYVYLIKRVKHPTAKALIVKYIQIQCFVSDESTIVRAATNRRPPRCHRHWLLYTPRYSSTWEAGGLAKSETLPSAADAVRIYHNRKSSVNITRQGTVRLLDIWQHRHNPTSTGKPIYRMHTYENHTFV